MNGKKIILMATFYLLIFTTIGFSDTMKVDISKAEVIPLDRLAQGKVNGEDLEKKVSAGRDLVIKASQGQTIPVKMVMDFPFLKTADSYTEMEFTRDTCLLISADKMMISPDCRNWTPFHDMKSVKKLYGAKQGTFNLGFAASDEHGPYLDFSLKLE